MNKAKAEYLSITQLRPFEGQPFQVKEDEEMEQLVWSILTQGLLTPLVVRPLGNNEYEVISGHRRLYACKKAGIETVPALVYPMSRDEAAVALVDSNLHREKLLPSEKAWAYKLKMEALKRQGQRVDLTSSQVGTRSDELLAQQTGESRNQVQRYIRLTNLIPGILRMVDEGRIALTPAVEISYLREQEQADLLETMVSEDCTPSLAQAIQMKQLSQSGDLDIDRIFTIMGEKKGNQKEKLSFFRDDISYYFPSHFTAAKMQTTIMELLKNYQRTWKRREGHDR